ncbi:MAG TPA: hypothetical protein PKX28_04860 [Candidatus Hydrogenedentes bacterium]|nr:hypothetical protein [Candidatus Hydrogenedentota bacterium]HPO30549.1 hypothetical protein [Candidatus Hydrogenedentota bacterium]
MVLKSKTFWGQMVLFDRGLSGGKAVGCYPASQWGSVAGDSIT